jgi:microcystin-dependent protein
MDPFVAEIRIFPFNFAPKGWAFCSGQLLPISQNTALFSLLGTMYGGDGKSNFALPNLDGSVPVNRGQSPGTSDYFQGQTGGSQTISLLHSEMPVHNHRVGAVSTDPGDVSIPGAGTVFAASDGGTLYQTAPTSGTYLAPEAIAPTGGGQPHNNMMPSLTLNFCIALQGVFPPRS